MNANRLGWLPNVYFILMLAGCSGLGTRSEASLEEIHSPSPGAAILSSATATPYPAAGSTQALSTRTPQLDEAPAATPNPPDQTITPTRLPEAMLTATAMPPGMALFQITVAAPGGQSMDGLWLFQIESGADGFWVTHLVKADATQEWFVQFRPQDFSNRNFEELYLRPVFWLPKEPYVFLSGIYRGKCGSDVFSLLRFNLKSGILTKMIPGSVCKPAFFSFSHTGRYLLHALPGQAQVTLQRLSDGSVSLVNLSAPNTFVSALSWSPDETRVVIETCQAGTKNPPACQSRPLFWLDAENAIPHRLLPDLNALKQDPKDTWESLFWLSANRISIHMQSGITWEVSLVSGRMYCRGLDGWACPHRAQTPVP